MAQRHGQWKLVAGVNELHPYEKEGFVYRITEISTGKMYIGKKSYWNYSKGQRVRQSNWKIYGSSGVDTAEKVSDDEADSYYNSRSYGSRIGAWASNQSSILKDREELNRSIKKFKDLYKDENNVPRPNHWSGWRLKHHEIEFWLDGENRIHERLKYIKENNDWKKILLSP